MVEKIGNPYCFKVLPLVYEQSLSYYEQLCKLTDKMNQLIDAVNLNPDSYVDEQIAKLREYVNAQDTKILNDSKLYTDEKINELNLVLINQIHILEQLVFNANTNTLNYVKLELDIFKNEIKNIPLPSVLNPITGKYETVQTVFYSFYDYLRVQAVNCYTFDSVSKTVDELDSMQYTAQEFDVYSTEYIYYPKFQIRSPFNGVMTNVQNVINELAALHQQGLAASAYDALEKTATEYDALYKTAYEYDWTAA